MKAIVDYSIIFYRFYHQMINRDYDINNLHELIVDKINGLSLKTGAMDMYLAGDLGASFRQRIYKGYKGNRLEKSKELKKLYFKGIAEMSQIYQFYTCRGLEADDICYLFAKKYPGSVVISEDSDMHQVKLLPNTELYLPFSGRFYSGAPTISLWTKVLLGDTSDNIPRCVGGGCGPQSVLSAFNKHTNPLGYLKSKYGIDEKALKRNKRLVIFSENDYSKFKLKL